MKTWISSALTACALVSLTNALASLPPRDLHRRTDFPPLPPCPQNNYKPYTYLGCFKEDSPRSLQYNTNLPWSTMTVETCTATCKSNGFKYAALIYYGYCYCGTKLPEPAPEADCNTPCNGNPSQICGANQRYSVWQDTTYPAVDPTTIASQYTPLGCYTDNGSRSRAISYRQDQLDFNTLTTGACLDACGKQNYPFAGTEFGGECYCGYQLLDGSAPTSSAECSTSCTGDATQTCGGPGRLSVYEAKILESTQPCGSAPPPPPSTCDGTAYGYVPGQSETFVSLGIGKNWGWVLTGKPPLSGPLYLGAGGNDISKATVVGSFTITAVGKNLVVTYTTNAPWYLSTTHFYYGSAPPSKIAPGQFGNTHGGLLAGTTTDTFTIPLDAKNTKYIVHAGISYAC
ncbi:hypothetical protein GJ744_008302 [Endocarpon pusillum]|uniref:WSC domain-containing protein n=1 Tax=Endocarpon pusillum TaxID=364733 RepID=A0A8H7ALQ0_9EURO|nr:hypothetical protein GJ744_008302 [Endocarpon pusillum]